MRRFFSILLFSLGALAFAQASTLTINTTTSEVVATSFKTRTFYQAADLIFIYRASNDAFEVQMAATRAKVWGGDIDSVTVGSASTAAQKFAKLRLYYLEMTTTTGYRVFCGRNDLKWNFTTATNVLQLQRASNGQMLWFGHIDSLQVSGVSGATNKLAWLRLTANRPFSTGSVTGGDVATIAAGAAAGSSPTVAVTGNNVAGEIPLTTGTTALNSGVLCTVTLPITAPTGTRVTLTASNANAATHTVRYFTTTTASTFVINATTTALSDATAYKWFYHVDSY